MNSGRRNGKHGRDVAREEQIQALLDGELDQASARALKEAAEADRHLARAIVDAYRLHRDLERLGTERAPRSLRRRLRRIPREQRRIRLGNASGLRRRALAAAVTAVAVVAVALVLLPEPGPTPAEIERAQRELAVAFRYLDRFVDRTGDEIQAVVGDELDRGIKEVLSERRPDTKPPPKENAT